MQFAVIPEEDYERIETRLTRQQTQQESYAQQIRALQGPVRDFLDLDWWSLRQVGEYFKVHPSTVWLWVKEGVLHAIPLTKNGKSGRVGQWVVFWTEVVRVEQHGRRLLEEGEAVRRYFPRLVHRATRQGKLF